MRKILQQVQKFWCINMHGELMWPFRGRYMCRVCLREYPVPFAAQMVETRHQPAYVSASVAIRRA
jgi:hypothetical protein